MPIIRSSRVLYRWLLHVVFGALVFKLSVWCGAEGYVSGLPSHPSGLFPLGFSTKTPYAPLLSPIHATCHSHLILIDLITQIIFGEAYRSCSFSLCSLLHSPVTSFLLGPNTLLNTLLSNALSLRSSLNVTDQDSHPYLLVAACGIWCCKDGKCNL